MTETTNQTPAERILITGASGNVGLETLRLLMLRPDRTTRDVVAGGRSRVDTETDTAVQPDGFVRLDFTDPGTFAAALAGVSRVLLVRPPQLADVDRYFAPFVQAMKQAGVRHVVFLSLQGVENNPVTPHHKIERLIVEAGLPFTFLRPSFFMQNLSTTHRDEIKDRHEIFIPAGRGRTSFVDVRDIAAVAELVLTNPTQAYQNRGYELTGSEALTYDEIAGILSRVVGHRITYRNPSIIRFIWQKWRREKNPLGFTLVMTALYTVSKLGKAARLTEETAQLLGRPPITFRQFADAYRSVWL
ncbi:SDR family oxidoreductase [Spirosoma sordidisoli]|uniref:SDR family oxidoreductase n=1 Tax=Spirosoma sordidisoli TaxID=2502893 RepID=A0A4Q2UI11_9BACT|nr:SDR family oxidoreductase [Spirosoma sordidisoli]RYC68746.1 SDR family oxidoreductase [Spirosoma sordidisoli]